MSPRELGALFAADAPPLTDEQVEAAARLFAMAESDVAA